MAASYFGMKLMSIEAEKGDGQIAHCRYMANKDVITLDALRWVALTTGYYHFVTGGHCHNSAHFVSLEPD